MFLFSYFLNNLTQKILFIKNSLLLYFLVTKPLQGALDLLEGTASAFKEAVGGPLGFFFVFLLGCF